MTLTTHAVVGSALGAMLAHNPALAAGAGFASHFIMDFIPHWDYPLLSMERDGNPLHDTMNTRSWKFAIDLIKIGCDFLLGFLLVGLFFYAAPSLIVGAFVGAAAAVTPDALQFLYMKFFQREPLLSLQKFHISIENEQLKKRPLIGVASQTAIILIMYLLTRLII